MRNFLFALLSVSVFSAAFAQKQSEPDSLLRIFKSKEATDLEKVKSIISICEYYNLNDFKKAAAYADSGMNIAVKSSQLASFVPKLYFLKGVSAHKQSLDDEAVAAFNTGLAKAQEIKDKLIEAKIYLELGIISEMTDQLARGLEYDQKALDIFIAEKDTLHIQTAFNNIGIIYWTRKEYPRAMEYFKKTLTLTKPNTGAVFKSRIINNIGLIFQEQHQFDSSLVYFQNALKKLDPEKHKYGFALVNNNLGISNRGMKRYDDALKHFEIARRLQIELNDQFGLGLVNYNIGRTYYEQGKYNDVIPVLRKGLVHATQSKNNDMLFTISELLAMTHEKLGDFRSALTEQKEAARYNDSIQSKGLNREIADLEVKYKVKQQQAENDVLRIENELQLSAIRNRDLTIAATVIISLLIVTLLFISYRALQGRLRATATIEEKNVKLEQLNHEKNSLMGVVAHDLKSPLNSIGGIAHILPRLGPLNDEQKQFVGIINNVVENSRKLIQDIMDLSALENKELKVHAAPVSINELIASCQSNHAAQAHQKAIRLVIAELTNGDVQLISDSRHIDRILQNLVSNAIKFSESNTTITIGARSSSDKVMFYVKDQGPGISKEDQRNLFRKFHRLSARPTQGESSSGLGLSIVKGLMDELQGTITIDSKIGEGTTFTCSIPTKMKSNKA